MPRPTCGSLEAGFRASAGLPRGRCSIGPVGSVGTDGPSDRLVPGVTLLDGRAYCARNVDWLPGVGLVEFLTYGLWDAPVAPGSVGGGGHEALLSR
jgi:hypothetical protein